MPVTRKLAVLERKIANLERGLVHLAWHSVADLGLYEEGWGDVEGLEPLAFAVGREGMVCFRGATRKTDPDAYVIFYLPRTYSPHGPDDWWETRFPLVEDDLANPGQLTAAGIAIQPASTAFSYVITGDGADGATIYFSGLRYPAG